jgi:hypothetical protein
MLLSHLLVLRLPFIASLLQCLHLAFVVAGFHIGLSESDGVSTIEQDMNFMSYFSLVSRRVLSAASASSSSSCSLLVRLSFWVA